MVEQEGVTIITTTHDRLVMEKAARVLELADGALQTGPTYFERDRREAIDVVPWAPDRGAGPPAPAGADDDADPDDGLRRREPAAGPAP